MNNIRWGPAGALLATSALLLGCSDKTASRTASDAEIAAAQESRIYGYVFNHWAYDVPRENPGECPDGFNLGVADFRKAENTRHSEAFKARYEEGVARDGKKPGKNACIDPVSRPDPGHIPFLGQASVAGLDLDGVQSSAAAAGQCAHDDFAGGIDTSITV